MGRTQRPLLGPWVSVVSQCPNSTPRGASTPPYLVYIQTGTRRAASAAVVVLLGLGRVPAGEAVRVAGRQPRASPLVRLVQEGPLGRADRWLGVGGPTGDSGVLVDCTVPRVPT